MDIELLDAEPPVNAAGVLELRFVNHRHRDSCKNQSGSISCGMLETFIKGMAYQTGATRYCRTDHAHSRACVDAAASAKPVLVPAKLDDQGAEIEAAVLGQNVREEIEAAVARAQALLDPPGSKAGKLALSAEQRKLTV